MSQKDQQRRGKWSLQQCTDENKQPNDSRSDGNSLVEHANINFNLIISPKVLRRNADTFDNPLSNRFSTPPSLDVEHDNFHQRNVTTSDGRENISRPRHPLYQAYESRLRSYSTWRQFQEFNVAALAEAGFYNIGNFTLEKMNNETQNLLHTDGSVSDPFRVISRNPGSWSASYRILCPQYQAYSVRLSTFARWPSDIWQRPEQVAHAGFYYTGSQDIVRCFACDGGLKNWDPDDEPWIKHARWFSQCPFVQHVKGQEFIDLVQRMTEDSDEEEDAVVYSTFQPDNPMADLPTLRNETNLHTNQVNESSVLETAAARIVLEMGYSRDVVTQAINSLIIKGQTEYKADHIMEAIFEMESRGQLLNECGVDTESGIGTAHDIEINGSPLAFQQENERLRQSVQCVNCKKSQRSSCLPPCTHFCLCSIYSETSSIFSICFTKIKENIKTYLMK